MLGLLLCIKSINNQQCDWLKQACVFQACKCNKCYLFFWFVGFGQRLENFLQALLFTA